MNFRMAIATFCVATLMLVTQAAAEWQVQTGTSKKSGKKYGIVYYEKDIPGPDDSTSEVILDCYKGDFMGARFAWHIHGSTDPDLFTGRFVYQFQKEKSVDINLKMRFSEKVAYYTADFPYGSDAADSFIEGIMLRDFVGVIGYFKDGSNTGVTTYDHENLDEALEEACGWHKDYQFLRDDFWFF